MRRAPRRRRAPALCWIGLAAISTVVAADRRALLSADLPDPVLAALAKEAATGSDADAIQRAILSASTPNESDVGLLRIDADLRWFAAMPPESAAGPFFEIRRWPGDSVVAFYALEGEAKPGGPPPIPAAETTAAPADDALWLGTIPTPAGRRTAGWIDSAVAGTGRKVGILLVPGDAGLGPEAPAAFLEEMIAMARRVVIRPEAWGAARVTPSSASIDLPRLLPPPAEASERKDVWQSIEVSGFSLSLPPGVRAVRLDGGLEAPRQVKGSVLWLRGRFLDRDDARVIVGDALRAGYVSVIAAAEPAWRSGEAKPRGAPSATRIAAEDFTAACEQSGADTASAERWREPGFEGDWIVFRILYGSTGIEIGLPVLAGRQSEALFWIPASWRAPGLPASPPPMDPAKRFGIDYRPLNKVEKSRQPWMEGVLTVPGLRIEVPKRWFAVVNLRSSDGFPVVFASDDRRIMGRLLRHPAGSAEISAEALAAWKPVKRPSKKSPESAYRREDGARLFLTGQGDGLLFVPEPDVRGAEWDRMTDTAVAVRTGAKDAPQERDER